MIDSRTLNEIIDRIQVCLHPEKIILFGSYARGNPTEDSDVDLLVVAPTDLPAKERFSFVSRLLGDYHAAFDVVFKTPEEYERTRSVVNHIVYFADRYGKVVYERGNS